MRKATEIHNQPLNGMNFDVLQKKKYYCLYVAVRNSSSSINCFSGKATQALKYAIGPPVVGLAQTRLQPST